MIATFTLLICLYPPLTDLSVVDESILTGKGG
jgi:hypothetical protein